MSRSSSPSDGSISSNRQIAAPSSPWRVARAVADATRFVLRRRFRVLWLVRDAYRHLTAHRTTLSAVSTDLAALLRMLVAWGRRSYRGLSWTALVAVVGAVCYFVLPADVLPDVLPGLGLVDDVAVISAVVRTVRSELEAFRAWEARPALLE